MLYVDGWDGMVIIVHRSIKRTFGAYKCPDNKGRSYREIVHFFQLYFLWFFQNIKEQYTNAHFIHNSFLFNDSSQKEYSGQSSAETSSFEKLYLPSNNADCAKRSSLSERGQVTNLHISCQIRHRHLEACQNSILATRFKTLSPNSVPK